MAEKDYTFFLCVPLRLEHYSDIRSLNAGFKSISFNFDFENSTCKIFSQTINDRIILETVSEYNINVYSDENFSFYYNYVVSSFFERLKNNEKKKTFSAGQPKKFPRRRRRKAFELLTKSDERRN